MNQIKYLLYACMILVLLFTGARLAGKLHQTLFVPGNSLELIDYKKKPDPVAAFDLQRGKELFSEQCASCHPLNKPCAYSLRGVLERGPWAEDRANLYKWIANPAAFIKTNEYAAALQKQYGSTMPGFAGQLTEKDIDAIFEYIDESAVY
ncbi:MAG TPA: c-type cytochrome [Flavisolibacter sp.]|nr:c-type cytochrome [Flavisolibacter sp.]